MAPECLPICICNLQINCKQMSAVNADVKRLSFSAGPIYTREIPDQAWSWETEIAGERAF